MTFEKSFKRRGLSKPSGFPGGAVVKNMPASAGDAGDSGLIPESEGFPYRRAWQPTLVFLSGESHGQRSLKGYHPWDHKESDTTEHAQEFTLAHQGHLEQQQSGQGKQSVQRP